MTEETISAIVSAATHTTEDSDAMRQNLIAVAEALQPVIERAVIRFGSLEEDQMWTTGSYPNQVTCHIGLRKYDGRLKIGVEETQYYPEMGDGDASIVPFSTVSRKPMTYVIERLPAFLEAYAAELKRKHQRYADLHKKAEQIMAVLEG